MFGSVHAINDLKIQANSSISNSKLTTIYDSAGLNSFWSAVNAECSTCHPPNIFYELESPASRQIIIQNTGNSSVITLKSVSVESADSNILTTSVRPSGQPIVINPKENTSFTISYDCKIDDIQLNKLKGWTIVKAVLNFDISNGGETSSQKVEFSYEKVCFFGAVSKFDFSLVILLTAATIIVYFGTQHIHTLFADQAQNSDEVRPIHAIFFIVFASAALLIFYFFKDYIIVVLTGLVCISSFSSCALMINELIEKVVGSDGALSRKVRLPVVEEVTIATIISSVASFLVVLIWVITKNWMLNNFIGVCVVLLVLRVVRLSSLRVATLLLGLAFFYDIFWVFLSKPIFGNSVMAYVATSLDLPLKLEWPHFNERFDKGSCGMLGLGDMVLPGLFLGYCYRFDKAKSTNIFHRVAVLGYAIGLALCGFFLVVLQLAQPALLYLVPSILGIVSLVAWKKQLLGELWVGLPSDSTEDSIQQGQLLDLNDGKGTALGEEDNRGSHLSELRKAENNN